MMGVKNVYAMKWGMSAWNKKFAYKWEEASADKDAPALETTDVPMAAVGTTTPTLTTGKATGAEIATAQVQKLLGEGFTPARVKFEDIAADMSKYYIISVQEKENYTLGHLPGAVNYDFATSFGKDQKLNTLPTDKPILVYCNSGQKAAFVVAYLRMLGYDAYSLLYGANGFMNSKLKTVKDATFTPELINKFDFIESEFKGDGGHGGGGC
jgi:rhodanese-related sulfurtransferase